MKVIVISAHPDDLEISCSGTLKKLQDQGATIISVLTVKPSAEDNKNRNHTVVCQELENSYRQSKFELRLLNTDLHKNGRPNLLCDNNTMSSLRRLLEPCDIAIIPNIQDYHQDHSNTHKLAWPLVCKLATETWVMDSWPYCQYYQQNHSNLFYDISDQWLFKEQLLKNYSSYLSDNDINKIKINNQWLGQRNNLPIAESFTIINKYVR